MKVGELTGLGIVVAASALASFSGLGDERVEDADFVAVEWSEKTGEKWSCLGLADRSTGRPMTNDTVFAICSNTKPIASVLALTFVEEGLIDLDDPVSKYFPEFANITCKGKPPKRPVTLRHLITHLSGLAYRMEDPVRKEDMCSYRDCVDYAVRKGLRKEPGESYQYCGLGFQVMGAVLEKVSGKTVTDLMEDRIFGPLEMNDTTFYPDAAMLSRLAIPYYFPPKGGTPVAYGLENRWTLPLDSRRRTALLSESLLSTAGDYLKFSQMLIRKGLGMNGRRILSEKTFDDYLLKRQTPAGDKVDMTFDIYFEDEDIKSDDHTAEKGGLFATNAKWNWEKGMCRIVFRAKSPYAPPGDESALDATGFGGKQTTFEISETLVKAGKATCFVSNNEDRHGIGFVELLVNGKPVGRTRVELAIGEAKRIELPCAAAESDKVEFRCEMVGPRKMTKVQLWFDTEDYTWDRSNDAIRELANILTEEGVCGHFNIVGQLGKFLVEKKREDVLKALKPHVLGTQTLYHSYHPNITEVTDLEDYDEAYRIALMQESEGVGMLKAALGIDKLMISCFPGNGSSHVALDVYADMGIPYHGGLGALDDKFKRGECYFLNQHHILYNRSTELEVLLAGEDADVEKKVREELDQCADYKMVTLYLHPHMLVRMRHWDIDNFCRGNNVAFGQWNPPEPLQESTTRLLLSRFRNLVRRIKTDPRFEFTDCRKMLANEPPRRPITMKEIPAIRASLLKDFGPVSDPASWCVADCFQAAVRLLRGEASYEPGKVYGFLSRPTGVSEQVTVRAADLRAAANGISFKRHLPVSYEVGGVTLGPADFLFAALEVLEMNAESVTVVPRDQLGDIAGKIPLLAEFKHTDGWIYWPQFKDRYLADRLRWQFWTLRW